MSENNQSNQNNQINKIIKSTIEEIEKKFGNESIMLLGQKEKCDVDVFSSGSYAINSALGIGGFPKGRIIEIFGPESSGKTTIALHTIAEIQKKNGFAAFIDVEHSIDPVYAKNLGIDIDNLLISQPDSGEQALEIVDILAKSGSIDLIVVDSVAALVPEAELNGEMKDQSIGLQARLMSKALRKITGSLSKNKTSVIFINQVREKIGVVFGNPETTPGGRALKFYASIRLDVRKSTNIMLNNDISGNQIRVKVVKNKLAPPFKIAETEIIFSKGINKFGEVADLALVHDVLQKKGAWFSYNGNNIAQGRQKLIAQLESNNELFEEIFQKIVEKENQKLS
ncbi:RECOMBINATION PROTEIN RECA [Mycoplasmopsis pulmonis]|uniref:Protein RecA n=1 Tax=Mycoplasmopsis pulmonis (strain UAB CTIP) TaxID=272635 RepID=RECA_MYCPU|nr:recombinase RecA [Mycoplasmopsis pulmonis]P29226.2 RecName: Full=Protein RecA; AltName: Full=Recombinase A [Mycoplasmopsis pulmonis UAB CTIP]AAA20406.1 sequence derived from overlapping PCR products [Mycoplasmopsis pulmonis]MDZ7293211.1 recombinase RecA [Mycoplasmopsis pulmonis]CAC13425.1 RECOMBINATION PROTEIN RECA [Mycoplasmopsis pulmonis]VEU68012.1 recombinase protein, RecA [Mycoplasmopsis pulmonis]